MKQPAAALTLALAVVYRANAFTFSSSGLRTSVPSSVTQSRGLRARFTPASTQGGPRMVATVQSPLAKEDEWVRDMDLDGFRQEVAALGKRLSENQGPEDVAHLQKIISWSNACAVVGLLSLWLPPNPITAMAISLWTFSRWTMIGHHICHGGYNRQKHARFTSRGFAIGGLVKRMSDWFDWMLPEAWMVEHNKLHHYQLGELGDPDLVERNLKDVREDASMSMPFKYAYVGLLMTVWKWSYYAPNTYKQLKLEEMRRDKVPVPEGVDVHSAVTIFEATTNQAGVYSAVDFWKRVLGPYLVFHFMFLPLPFAAIGGALGMGGALALNAVGNLLLAEVLTNIHSFIVIVTNHAGGDLYKFSTPCIPKTGTFYLRQVISSANHRTGGDVNDFMHGWLNYQIEHHVWPELSMLSYQRGQPELKAICEKYKVPYVQENVFTRLRKTVDIMVGKADMREFDAGWDTAMQAPQLQGLRAQLGAN